MRRLLWALADLKEHVLSQAPKLFATMAEAPLEDLERLRQEGREFSRSTQACSLAEVRLLQQSSPSHLAREQS